MTKKENEAKEIILAKIKTIKKVFGISLSIESNTYKCLYLNNSDNRHEKQLFSSNNWKGLLELLSVLMNGMELVKPNCYIDANKWSVNK